ncbi:MAG: ATP synthase F1 subunit epsilon [Clostridiales bacterium]|nr:ATP synthase F1 subunit epsilon [Clostridiales bacterium]
MNRTVKLEVITPSKMFYKGEVELVVVTTPDGEEGFMANHSWAVKLVDIGPLRIREPGAGETREAFVSGGYIDVKENILVYVDAAEWVEDIDYEKQERQKEETSEYLKGIKDVESLSPEERIEYDRIEKKHRRAVERMRLVRKHERQGRIVR